MQPLMCGLTWLVLISTINSIFLSSSSSSSSSRRWTWSGLFGALCLVSEVVVNFLSAKAVGIMCGAAVHLVIFSVIWRKQKGEGGRKFNVSAEMYFSHSP